MGCNQGTVTDTCKTEQSFCTINGQKVSDNTGIDASLLNITQHETLVSDTLWNRIYTVLKNIYNYGKRGTRNPSISDLNDVSDNDEILQDLYNDIINLISTSGTIENQPIITKKLMDNLQTKINNYKLNKNRCNSCNTKCNATCEASSQCSGCENSGGGGCDLQESCYRACCEPCAQGYPMSCGVEMY